MVQSTVRKKGETDQAQPPVWKGRRSVKLLVLDTAYTLEAMRERGLEATVTCRDLRGYFSHVWSVHPFATLLTSEAWGPRYGHPDVYQISAAHTLIEGKIGRFAWLERFFALNFLLSQVGLLLMLVKLIRAERIDVIRSGSPLYLGLFSWALSRLCGIPFVVRVGANHDKIFENAGVQMEPRLLRHRRIEKMVERFIFKRADLVAGANQDNLDFALANGARLQFTTLFRYGNLIADQHLVDPSERHIDAPMLSALGVEPGNFLLYIGRLEAPKHPDDLVRVLGALTRRGYDLKLFMSGDGRLRNELADLARELGVDGRVIFAGNCSQDQLAQLIPTAVAVISPHTGRALAEAAFGAAPIAAYDLDWQGELIRDDVTGALLPHRDWKGLADAVAKYIDDPDHATRMGRAARERAFAILDPLTLDRHEQEEYDKLIERSRA